MYIAQKPLKKLCEITVRYIYQRSCNNEKNRFKIRPGCIQTMKVRHIIGLKGNKNSINLF